MRAMRFKVSFKRAKGASIKTASMFRRVLFLNPCGQGTLYASCKLCKEFCLQGILFPTLAPISSRSGTSAPEKPPLLYLTKMSINRHTVNSDALAKTCKIKDLSQSSPLTGQGVFKGSIQGVSGD